MAPFLRFLRARPCSYGGSSLLADYKPVVLAAALIALGSPWSLSAQVVTGTATTAQPTTAKAFSDAVQHRTDVVNYVLDAKHTSVDALQQLHAVASPTGMKLDADADFAFGAIDIGRRLLLLKKPTEAQAFFQAADTALTLVIGRTSDSSVSDKVQYLKVRADIRATFLNRLSDARADFDAALKLSPSDQHLQQLRRLLPADPAATLQNHQGLPAKG